MPARGGLVNRLAGAWYGRIAGCMLGRPVECWTSDAIEAYLKRAEAWPLADYVPYVPEAASPDFSIPPAVRGACRGHLTRAIRDDDLDFTVLNLTLLERHGARFTTARVADQWLHTLPYRRVYTAEEATYRNLVMGVPAEAAGAYRNPFREWVGARIRADTFGYANPGKPREAARMAFRDAVLSHRKNGVYSAMAAAAMVSEALVASDLHQVLSAGRSVLPARSRLFEAVSMVQGLVDQGASWQDTLAAVEQRYGGYAHVHAIPNDAIVWLALIYGAGDYSASITLAAACGKDTDCNAATVGSIVGALVGFAALPGRWTEPLNDTLEVALAGVGTLRISDLVERTWRLARGASGETRREEPA
ncbi:crystallin [Limnochorda pilosa]|uniref:Crystallin n=1 Tax=Limnochorda pilosa TaxID=1555112 RepID=A0A0K2SMC4_LIMPI|nr:crystallin [Limnochorda pilosa]